MNPEELDLDIDLEQAEEKINKKNKIQERITGLIQKEKTTAQERDELAKARKAAEDERDALKKDVEFYSKFSDSVTKYKDAAAYKDRIREKVMAGYDVEDATISVLAKEGKYGNTVTPEPIEKDSPIGGSAVTQTHKGGQKPLNEMNKQDLKQALMEAQSRGDLAMN